MEPAAHAAVVPFSDETGGIAVFPQDVGDSCFVQGQVAETSRLPDFNGPGSVGIPPGQKRRSGRSAQGRGRVVLREGQPFPGKSVESRCLSPSFIEDPEIAVAHIIGHNLDNIRVHPSVIPIRPNRPPML